MGPVIRAERMARRVDTGAGRNRDGAARAGNASWKNKPSWYLVATDDKMIPPNAERFMAKRAGAIVAEAQGSHAIYVSQPEVVAGLIAQAAEGDAKSFA